MTILKQRSINRFALENNSVHTATKTLGNNVWGTLPQAGQRLSLDLFSVRSGTAGSVDYIDVTAAETLAGSRVLFRHRFKRASWVAGQRLYGDAVFPGGCPAAAGAVGLTVTLDTMDSGSCNFQMQGCCEVANG